MIGSEQQAQNKQSMSQEQLAAAIQTVRELLSSSGVRFTEKRQKLLEVLLTSAQPLSAYELVDKYRLHHHEELQVMSAYRILEFFLDEHLVHKLNLNNKYVACSQVRCCAHHKVSQFMICTQCNQVEEIFIPTSLWKAIVQCGSNLGYCLDNAHLEVACICQRCKKEQTD